MSTPTEAMRDLEGLIREVQIDLTNPNARLIECDEDRLRAALEALRQERDEQAEQLAAFDALYTATREHADEAEARARAAEERAERAEDFIARSGYRRCDVPACNCGSWHGGLAYARLSEVEDALEEAGYSTNGRTILAALNAALHPHRGKRP